MLYIMTVCTLLNNIHTWFETAKHNIFHYENKTFITCILRINIYFLNHNRKNVYFYQLNSDRLGSLSELFFAT